MCSRLHRTPSEHIMTVSDNDSAQLADQIATIRGQLSKVHHDINNPLAVISGNVELVTELVKMLGMEADLSGPLDDISLAVEQLTMHIDRLMVVRNQLSTLSQQLDSTS